MRPLQSIPGHQPFLEELFPFDVKYVGQFYRFALNGKLTLNKSHNCEFATIGADNLPDSEHERAMMYFGGRCPTWPEMVALKTIFWTPDEICIQVHPSKENYINLLPYALHLWKPKDRTSNWVLSNTVKPLVIRALSMLARQANTSPPGSITEGKVNGKQFVAIFCGNNWLEWTKVCSIKNNYFGENATALQFNLSPEIDLNPGHILLLWNAADFDIQLPPKEYV